MTKIYILYSENDINDIIKDTSKEIELTNYIEEKDYDYFWNRSP